MVDDESTLDIAVHRGGLPIIRMLLRNGSDMGARDINNLSVLDNAFREAVKIGGEAVARFLLEEGADIKCRSPVRYETALHTAIRLEQWSMLKILLDNGIDINARNRERETALFGAAIGRARDDPFRKYFVCYNKDVCRIACGQHC
jgi:ankyrin repeat protein